jgi:hypothetical protein
MSILVASSIGAVAGLIVSSWQGFKDPPWEGFFVAKFLRSIAVGAAAGAGFALAESRGRVVIDNLGVLAFAVVAVERAVGEAYKGFFRPGPHAEYSKLLGRFGVKQGVYFVKLLLGAGFLVAAYWLFRLLGFVLERTAAEAESMLLAGLVGGVGAGLMSATGGALKDSQFEGFLLFKFFRSPIVAGLLGMILVQFSTSWFLLALAMLGGERVGVELYKTFLKRQVRGIHAGEPVSHPFWMAHRGVFAISYSLAVAVCLILLLT